MRYTMEIRFLFLLPSLGMLLLFAATPPQVRCQYEVEQERPFWARGLFDVRVARGGRTHAWTSRGLGKTRYGGRTTPQGSERVTRLSVAQLALEARATLPWDIIAHAQLNWYPDSYADDRPLLIEAYFRKEWGGWEKGWGVQTGVINPPFSLEHREPARTPQYTLTPSALNTWIWEEGRVVGIEGQWWQTLDNGMSLSILAGAGFGPDQMGHLLAVRGWILSDMLAGINSDAPLPELGQQVPVFDERDHRPSIYSLVSLKDSRERVEFSLGYFDTLGNQNTQGVWETRLGTTGIILRPFAHVEFLSQYMEGVTQSKATCDISFSAWYGLLSFPYRGHRLSIRYDFFRTNDLDGAPFYREHGDGVTLAYLFEFGLHHRVGFEYIWLHSRYPLFSDADPSDSGWQLSYRFRY